MHRFYTPESDLTSKKIFITDHEELHHLKNVLRLKKDAAVRLFNGKGREASGKLLNVSSGKAEVQILSLKTVRLQEPKLILACAIPKKSKFEWIIEKATELGADEIIPMKTKRTEIHFNKQQMIKKRARYQTVAINAAKQSQRSFVPTIHPVTDFISAVRLLSESTQAIIPSLTGNRQNILNVFKDLESPHAISFLIGPEGDFTPEEYAFAKENNCAAVTLGETILKVETAAICALSSAHLYFRS